MNSDNSLIQSSGSLSPVLRSDIQEPLVLEQRVPPSEDSTGNISNTLLVTPFANIPRPMETSQLQRMIPRRSSHFTSLRNPSLWSEGSDDTSFSRAYTVSADIVNRTHSGGESRVPSEFVADIINLWKQRGSIVEEETLLGSRPIPVVIIGTGWIGRALSKRLVKAGVPTLLGSRNPDRFTDQSKQAFAVACPVLSIPNAIEASQKILILAIPVDGHATFAADFGHLIPNGFTVVDVSNDQKPGAAEKLRNLLPHAKIVKAFNTVAAYHLNSDSQLPNPVMASGDAAAKTVLRETVLKPLGFSVFDLGGTESMSHQERIPMQFFDKWRAAFVVLTGLFAFWFVYSVLWFVVLPMPAQYPGDTNAGKPMHGWEGLPLSVMNKVFALTGFSLLGVTYLPGQIAGLFQLYSGTAKCPFPLILGGWMNIRKYLGLLSMWLIGNHVLLSCLRLSRDYAYYPLYNHDDESKWTGRDGEKKMTMTWSGELCMLLGVLSFSLFCITMISSLPSVSTALSWREWQFVQSTLGFMGLLLAFLHVFFYGAAFHLAGLRQDLMGWQYFPTGRIPPPHWTSLGIPGLFLSLRLILGCPGISHRLQKIRKG